MTNDEYLMLRSIAAVKATEGPDFDHEVLFAALLTELLDVYDTFEELLADTEIATALKRAGIT